jgi:hypothetical protein
VDGRQAGERAAAGERALRSADVESVYRLLRLALPGAGAARAALARVLAAADAPGDELPAGESPRAGALLELVLRRLAVELAHPADRPPPQPAPAAAVARSERAHAGFHSEAAHAEVEPLRAALGDAATGVSAETLQVLVRALPAANRAVVALRVLYEVGEERVAATLRRTVEEVRRLERAGLDEIRGRLVREHAREGRALLLASKPLPRLRPLPVRADGLAVIQGTRVLVEPMPSANLFEMALRALQRIVERFRRHRDELDPSDDEAHGERRSHAPLDPTPTTQPFARPRPTPSMEPHRAPKPTPGTSVHRTPRSTPSTERLSNPGHAISSGARTHGWTARR